MDSRAVAGLSFIVIMSILLAGSYAALMPTALEVSVHNRSGSSASVDLVLAKDGRTLKSWRLALGAGESRSVNFQLDIGTHELTASSQGSPNVTATFDIPFKLLDKAHSESFTLLPSGIFHGNIY